MTDFSFRDISQNVKVGFCFRKNTSIEKATRTFAF
jgi:hypothetical protein